MTMCINYISLKSGALPEDSLVREGITEDQNSLPEKLQCPHLEFRNRVDKVDCYLGNGIFHGAVTGDVCLRRRCVFTPLHLSKIT